MPSIVLIGGDFRGRRLQGSPGSGTRPLISRARKSLFDILGVEALGGAWLDLFAGTGSVGLEALSRGAPRCDFVDSDRRAVEVIQRNIETLGIQDRTRVYVGDALKMGPALFEKTEYQVIFAGPPFGQALAGQCLARLDEAMGRSLHRLVLQYPIHESMPQGLKSFERLDERKYGDFFLGFWTRR